MKKTLYLFFCYILLSSCTSNTDNIITTPKLKKLTREFFNPDGTLNGKNVYNYSYNENDIIYKIEIIKTYSDRPERNKDYTLTRFFNGNKNTYDTFEYRLDGGRRHTKRINYTYNNNLISEVEIISSENTVSNETFTYNSNELLIEKNNVTYDFKYSYEYDNQKRLIKSTYSNDQLTNRITEYKYLDVLNPSAKTATPSAIKAYNLSNYIKIEIDQEADIEKNEYNLPTKIKYTKNNSDYYQIVYYEY